MESPELLRPLNTGLVGLRWGGYVAETLLRGKDQGLFNVTAACDADASLLADFSNRHGLKACGSLDALLQDPDIRVVGLFTSPSGRADLLRRIIRAGKDVMTTKPFELDPIAARNVLEEARSLGRTIHLNSPAPEWPDDLLRIRQWREEFDLGAPVSCRGEMLVSYREEADGRWFDDPRLCPVAPVFRLGIYVINDLSRLFGRVGKVQAMSSRMFTGRPTADNGQISLLFENSALGSIHASFCVENGQHYANSLILNYERGTIWRNVFPVAFDKAAASSRLLLAAARGNEVVTRETEMPGVSGDYQWATLHAAITKRSSIAMPIDDIVHGVEIIAAMARAEQSGNAEPV